MPALARITEYTDPGCPWAYSAEPFRRRIDWTFGEQLEWEVRLVVLADDPQEYIEKGFTAERQAAAMEQIAHDHGMPIDTRERERMAATAPACRAVVAARRHDPPTARRLLRSLRVHSFTGDALLDEDRMLTLAAQDAGIDPQTLADWIAEPETERELDADRTAARSPMPAALALDEKLAGPPGERRYTCPSLEIQRVSDGAKVAVPGFQPYAVYSVALANLLPDADRRPAPEDPTEILAWAGEPVATAEVAQVIDTTRAEARERLEGVAEERPIGTDGFWSLRP